MIYVLLLLLVTAVWGWTFVLVKDAISQYPTLPFLAIRFAIALLVMAVAVRRVPGRRVVLLGAAVGAALAAGYLLQTLGLQFTSPGNAGLITGLLVVLTPIIDRAFGARLPPAAVIAAIIALVGLGLLAGGPTGVRGGDVLVLGCAAAFALHIVLLGRWAPGAPPGELALVQMGLSAVVFTAAAGAAGQLSAPPPAVVFTAAAGAAGQLSAPPPAVWPALAVTGVVASAIGFFVQTWAQAHLAPARVALIIASEPAWALLFSVVLASQRFGPLQALGAALVLVAVLGYELLAVISERRQAADRIGPT